MQARVKWLDHMTFVGETGSGHTVVMDGSPDLGGRNLAARPMELLLLGLGGCTAFDVVLILRKSRQEISDCEVKLSAERASGTPAVFSRIHLHYVVSGAGLSLSHVERAVKLSSEKYCSATVMLGKTATITHDFEILES